MHTEAFIIAVYSGEQVCPMGLLFIKTSPVKQCSSENDFSGVFDALHQSFLVVTCIRSKVSFGYYSSRPSHFGKQTHPLEYNHWRLSFYYLTIIIASRFVSKHKTNKKQDTF